MTQLLGFDKSEAIAVLLSNNQSNVAREGLLQILFPCVRVLQPELM